jgi:peptide-methionine (R)-S-oxide reductase
MKTIFFCIALSGYLISCTAQETTPLEKEKTNMEFKISKTEEEWRKTLTQEQYYVLREKGTERPYTGKYNMFFEDGTYHCSACSTPLFTSDSKFDSHCGWPSFDRAISDSAIVEVADYAHGMVRTEIMCGTCGGHIGHVFDDGPTETGLRYCVNSISVEFDEAKKENPKK